ncbi:hypothetical protein BKK51_01850 [Rodentibacter trehalosifermentans]|uniref:Lipoprotein n=1 Tax=Rodentibacter trehalosifermentans TaxID=1908263 RepID=A0A1V3IWF7_9PAST|nr:hypothetical protein [Rodentibacter trehalosifermentans]OOF46628.1 hypothetical protein BKK52_11135 [Rodentibacter trehalosifermentans]OOF46644.1 hypothetical protein BKK51_01850 [Rodentibacter trehalosifermentans]
MKKNIFILITIFIISGCYSIKEDCYHGMTTICFGEPYSSVAKFQKPYSLGRTDSQQRWDDLVACGAKRGDLSLHSAWRKALEPLNKELLEELSSNFRKCMKSKGYVSINDCGRKNSTTDKRICNE